MDSLGNETMLESFVPEIASDDEEIRTMCSLR